MRTTTVSTKNEPDIYYVMGLENFKKEQDVPVETKSILKEEYDKLFCHKYNNGFKTWSTILIPAIKDVRIFNERVVKVYFADNTTETAVLDEEDKFSIDTGITICLAKKIMGGSSIYNKTVDYAKRVMNNNRKKEEKRMKDQAEEKARKERAVERDKKRKERRKNKKWEQEMCSNYNPNYLYADCGDEDGIK